ncbi:MAG: hypothetical protein KatS3mg126_0001 [Lysobacteraceae bacterium]|jgi:hypothetical protein|uniref:Uncharacterized protein n=1 Tax=Rehaibacterium terrae TaxID=1341696 RepID=A0A7W7Y1M2_9GAMM|nr:hypothetical protein [Rehaibacterium terrae]GIX34222.1 MAG: hypothetical protein KatS3mg126_0001 [Xanthomonadaceae bacterium]
MEWNERSLQSCIARIIEVPVRLVLFGAMTATLIGVAIVFIQGTESPLYLDHSSDSPGDAEHAPLGESALTPSRPFTSRVGTTAAQDDQPPAGVLLNAASASEGFDQAVATFGLDDYRVAHLAVVVQGLCTSELDPRGALQAPVRDVSREWAVEALIAYCTDFRVDTSALPPSRNAPESILSVERQLGREAALSFAREVLRGEVDVLTFQEASLYLLEHGAIPKPSAFGLSEDRFGFADQQLSLAQATNLLVCELSGGCGPYSPFTLGYCVQSGCSPGSTLWMAYQENLSPGAYHLLRSYYAWLRSQRTQ